jgi:hypothetical protein
MHILFIFEKTLLVSKYRILFLVIALFYTMYCHAQNQAKFSDIKPGMSDRWLEREGVRLANKRGMNYAWHERYFKAIIISGDWEPYFTCDGFLKGRLLHMELYAEMPNGKCAMGDFTFKQKLLEDDTLSDLYYDSAGDLVYVDCE